MSIGYTKSLNGLEIDTSFQLKGMLFNQTLIQELLAKLQAVQITSGAIVRERQTRCSFSFHAVGSQMDIAALEAFLKDVLRLKPAAINLQGTLNHASFVAELEALIQSFTQQSDKGKESDKKGGEASETNAATQESPQPPLPQIVMRVWYDEASFVHIAFSEADAEKFTAVVLDGFPDPHLIVHHGPEGFDAALPATLIGKLLNFIRQNFPRGYRLKEERQKDKRGLSPVMIRLLKVASENESLSPIRRAMMRVDAQRYEGQEEQ